MVPLVVLDFVESKDCLYPVDYETMWLSEVPHKSVSDQLESNSKWTGDWCVILSSVDRIGIG